VAADNKRRVFLHGTATLRRRETYNKELKRCTQKLTVLAVLRAGKHASVPVAVSSGHVGRSAGAGHLSRHNGRGGVRHPVF